MKPVSQWNFMPYTPLDRPERAQAPYICRIAPQRTSIVFDFIDNGTKKSDTHTLYYRRRDAEDFTALPLDDEMSGYIPGLAYHTDYEFYVVRDGDGTESIHRLARTGTVAGKVVNYLHPDDPAYDFSGQYLSSPCLVRLPSGRLLSSMDVFGNGTPQNLTLIFSSDDDGETWQYLTELFPCVRGQMFYGNDRLYMLGCSTGYGDLLIGASDNEGRDWTLPTVLFRGVCPGECGLHRAPMPFCEHAGRIWTDVQFGSRAKKEMNDAVLSAPADCGDYTDPSVWTMTELWQYTEHMKNDPLCDPAVGAIEGNLVVSPDGNLYDFLRYVRGKCLLLSVDPEDPDAMPTFAGFPDIPITPSKFEIHRDEETGDYYAICSRALNDPPTKRNLLSLFRSTDLLHWECVRDLIDARSSDPEKAGFQSVSFLIEGDDILFLCRTAWNEPHNFHDSNYQTFHRIRDFRSLS